CPARIRHLAAPGLLEHAQRISAGEGRDLALGEAMRLKRCQPLLLRREAVDREAPWPFAINFRPLQEIRVARIRLAFDEIRPDREAGGAHALLHMHRMPG